MHSLIPLIIRGELQILDISNPATPLLVGIYKTPNNVIDNIFISNTHLFLGYGYSNVRYLKILDISNPASPLDIGQCGQLSSNLACITVDNSYAYIASNDYTWAIYDVSDPSTCHRIYLSDLGGNWITVKGSLVCKREDC